RPRAGGDGRARRRGARARPRRPLVGGRRRARCRHGAARPRRGRAPHAAAI
ncbi:MAG: hypothetical protein AVDCRST_MAG39-1453, partial [uncultured Sphingomonadaceae bacterium]